MGSEYKKRNEPQVNRGESSKVTYGESIRENLALTQDRQFDGVTEGEGLTGELSQNVVPSGRSTLVRREEAIRRSR
jgi:hypothetical protein